MKKLRLELLDDNGQTVVTHTLDYDDFRYDRMRLSIGDNKYIMDTNGKLAILTQNEINQNFK